MKTLESHKIGITYENLFKDVAKKKTREREGIFYTPPGLARVAVSRLLTHWLKDRLPQKIKNISVLDPSCGAGAFLIEAAAILTKTFNPSQIALCGVDKDFNAVEHTQNSLRKLHSSLNIRIRGGNSLISKTPDMNIDSLCPIDWQKEFPNIIESGGFDLIVGNPPYGLSRGEKFHPLEKKIIEARYHWIKHGKLNKYIAFSALSYELLRPGGMAALIIPNSWLGIDSGHKLRSLLLETNSLKELTVLPATAFEDPSVETVILIFKKPDNEKENKFKIQKLNDKLELIENKNFYLTTEDCLKLPSKIIPLNLNEIWIRTLDAILRNSTPLKNTKSPFIPRIAIQAYAVGKGCPAQTEQAVKNKIYDTYEKESPDAVPYLNGKDITPFSINWSGLCLKHGPWLAEPQSLDRFKCPRLLIREILAAPEDPIIAAFTDKPFLYNKSVIHIAHRDNNADELLALLALLSSQITAFIINSIGRKSQRKLFPKLVLADLNSFPIPQDFTQHTGCLANLGTKLMQNPGRPILTQIKHEIDMAVAPLYGIDLKQLKTSI